MCRFDAPDGVLVCSVDNLPTEMAAEASKEFGDVLLPIVWDMVNKPMNFATDSVDLCCKIL